jgi:hypothetical protein
MNAGSDNICSELQRFLKTFFPTEVKRKRRANAKEMFEEQRLPVEVLAPY